MSLLTTYTNLLETLNSLVDTAVANIDISDLVTPCLISYYLARQNSIGLVIIYHLI